MGSIGDFKTTQSQLILFTRSDCSFCEEAKEIIEQIDKSIVDIKIFVTFKSRIEGKLQMRPLGEPPEDFPILVDESEIPEVPCLYDPVLGQRMLGVDSIEKYLEDVGLI